MITTQSKCCQHCGGNLFFETEDNVTYLKCLQCGRPEYPEPTLREKKQKAGRLGGTINYMRYGSEEMSRRGKLGGRPRLQTLSDKQDALYIKGEEELSVGRSIQKLKQGVIQKFTKGELLIGGSPGRVSHGN